MPFSAVQAEVVALVLECCFFGIFTALVFTALWVLFNKSSAGRTSRPLILIVCSMYLLAITNLSIDIYRAMHAFASVDHVAHGSGLGHGKFNHPTEIAKSAVYSLQTLLADGFFVWRCYVVWNKRWSVVALPIIMVVGETVSAAGLCWTFSKAKHVPLSSVLTPWITATFSMILATNVVCSALIIYRIWRSQRLTGPTRTFVPVMVMVIESGAIYSAALISVVVTYSSGNNTQYLLLDFLPSLMGTVFTLIVVRVALGISSNGNASSQWQVTHAIPNSFVAPSREEISGNHSMKSAVFSTSVGGTKEFDVESGYSNVSEL